MSTAASTTTGGELITGILRDYGIGTVFAVAGASHAPLLDALDRAGIRIISSRHEAGAVGAADGYARVTGKPGVALIVAEQGLPNSIGALAVAWQALSPVLVIAATAPRAQVEADTLLDHDRLALVAALSKWSRTVPDIRRLADHLHTGIKHALVGRRGPAVLLLPGQLLGERLPAAASDAWPLPTAPQTDAATIAAAATALAAARRPLIIAGNGAVAAGEPLRRFATDHRIPVMMNGLGRGVVREDDELGFPWPYAQPAARHADVVLVLGARLTQRLGLGLPPRFAPDARFIQVDIVPEAMHRNRRSDIPIHADCATAIADIARQFRQIAGQRVFANDWLHAAIEQRKAKIAALLEAPTGTLQPLQLAAAVNERMGSAACCVADGADIATWLYGCLRIDRPRAFMDHYPMGAMGCGTALAVGAAAAVAERDAGNAKPVVLVTGDGAIGFHPAELHAAARAGLRLIVVVGNDGAWGTELHAQRASLGRDINTQLGQLRYELLAELFGGRGLLASTAAELEQALSKAFEEKGVVVVNALIDQQAGALLKQDPDLQMIQFSDLIGDSDPD
ncbi:MAG: thiamine pyrophosphate-binding protein [Gammaproteobacteria bacterium]|nr:MAG: thiamine pyrophosphate-binding protein [Gammaproteobacteria bacterium]